MHAKPVRPMLATLVKEPFDRKGWLFEVKLDGYRLIARVIKESKAKRQTSKATLQSRHGKDYTARYRPVAEALSKLKHDAVLDGELIALGPGGSFQGLRGDDPGRRLRYVVFDLLSLDGKDLRERPLVERKKILKRILPKASELAYSEHVMAHGQRFFAAAKKKGFEGIVAKDSMSPYREGVRGREWLKVKARPRQEVVVAGFTAPRRSRKFFGALVVGVHENGKLRYAGHVGAGFDRRSLREAYEKMKSLVRKTSPFEEEIETNAPVTWLKPELVADVGFAGWTGEGRLRQASFIGWREDKRPEEVVRELPEAPAPEKPKSRSSPFSNLNKIFWPKEAYTKGDVIAYYREMAPLILPHLKDRPMSLNRHPDGIEGESFFQKDVSGLNLPQWAKTRKVLSESAKREITYILCNDRRTLLYLANLGCIEMNPWSSRVGSLDEPDFAVMDIDPEEAPFSKALAAALAVREVCEELGVPGFPKTSGGRGLHVYIPLAPGHTYEQSRRFAELVAALASEKLGGMVSRERRPGKRKGKIYFDVLQNRFGVTNASAYSLRPRPGAPVSAPLAWSEVKTGLDPLSFNIKTMLRRVERLGDLFAPVLGRGVSISEVMKRVTNVIPSRGAA